MASEAAGSTPLATELLHTGVYKASQGRVVRQVTCGAIWLTVVLGCWRLYATLAGSFEESYAWAQWVVPLALLCAGLWVGYRLVNWPQFADFLIAVEAELKKVSWPTRGELVRASGVVIFTIFFLAITLFLFDVLWKFVFDTAGVTS